MCHMLPKLTLLSQCFRFNSFYKILLFAQQRSEYKTEMLIDVETMCKNLFQTRSILSYNITQVEHNTLQNNTQLLMV